jgi:hypothetical protein
MKRKLATLTPEEEKAWNFAYAMYADPLSSTKKDKQAAEMAWVDMQEDFPRLRKFDGARP